jgi:UDP-N-acetylglucosamine--N-acetylmuramyl-(pentapeptide) pyrophosphoryl-undecaprenol N-acetylglucosamine transferase
MRILLAGGGTMGSVSPLLVIAEELEAKCQMSDSLSGAEQGIKYQMLWIGTKRGPEKKVVEKYQIPFQPIFSGKLRRYFDWRNFIDPIFIFLGLIQSFFVLLKFKPNIILAAGSFVSLPVVWAGWLLRIPSLIHQQDIRPSLTNKLTAPFAKRITVTFEKSLRDFSSFARNNKKNKVIWTGNPIRKKLQITNYKLQINSKKLFNLEENLPTILVIGGGTGALGLNNIILAALPELTKFCQIIHLTGGKNKSGIRNQESWDERYHEYNFLTDKMKDAYAVADLVICRAGIGTLTELAALGKPAILVPIPNSHQEENAKFFEENKAAISTAQKKLTPEKLVNLVKETLDNKEKLKNLKENIQKLSKPNAAEKIVKEIFDIIK